MFEPITFVEESICLMPAGSGRGMSILATADGHVGGFWSRADGTLRFVWDGVAGPPFDGTVPMPNGTQLFWSGDHRHVAYIGIRGSTQFVGRDGAEDPAFELISRSVPPTFSHDGSHLVYGAQVAGVYRLVVDATIGHDELAPIAATFSPDGSHLAFVLFRDGTHHVVVDERTVRGSVKLRNAAGVLQFSPDSQRFAFYEIGRGEGRWVIDGTDGRWVNEAAPLDLAALRGIGKLRSPMPASFSPDSRRFAYWADVKEKGVAVIEDETAGPLLRKAGVPTYSPDSRHLAYIGETFTGKEGLVKDGVFEGDWPPAIYGGFPVFSPDSQHVAYVHVRQEGGLLRKRRIFMVIMDSESKFEGSALDGSRWPVFSPDSQHVAWWTQSVTEGVVYVDGAPRIRGKEVQSEPIVTSRGSVVCAMAFEEGVTVHVDDRRGPLTRDLRARTPGSSGGGPVDPSNPHFCVSPGGDHVAWAGSVYAGVRPVLDDHLGSLFDEIFSAEFDHSSVPTWLALRGDAIIRVTAMLTSS